MRAFYGAASAAVTLMVGQLAAAPPAAGSGVVLLDDFSLREGQIQKSGLYVFIKPPAGGNGQAFPLKQILFEGKTRDDVYDFVAGKSDKTTAAGTLRLAQWCEKVGMLDRAAIHARAAAKLANNAADYAAFVRRVDDKSGKAKPAAVPTAMTPDIVQTAAVVPAPPSAMVPSLNPLAANAFATRIQPVLTNLCARCHAAKDYAGEFKLARIPEGFVAPDSITDNLKAVAAQLSKADAGTSPFLAMMLDAHGGAKLPPVANHAHAVYQNAELWAYWAVAPAGTPMLTAIPLRGLAPTAAPWQPPEPNKLPPLAVEPIALPGTVVGESGKTATPPAPVAKPPVNPSSPSDPFDPETFNRLPKKK